MLLWVMGVEFRILVQFLENEISSRLLVPRLYKWIYKILRLTNTAVKNSVVLVMEGYQPGGSASNSHGWSLFNVCSTKFLLGTSWCIKCVILVEDNGTGGPSSITFRMEQRGIISL